MPPDVSHPRPVRAAPRRLGPAFVESDGFAEYRLLDLGHGRKLERLGPYVIDRPEPQALGARRLPDTAWDEAHAVFVGHDEETAGRWRFAQRLPEAFPVSYRGLPFLGRFTPFRHLGVFPEQAPHWDELAEALGRRPGARVLNLFAYTGVASLIAARAGAMVTHVDASKRAIAQARENQALAQLEAAPIRWILDDAGKFVARERRRGALYDVIVLDPPKFGRGPAGETFDLFENLPDLMRDCRALLSEAPIMVLLTAYAIRASFMALEELMAEIFADAGGLIDAGEILLVEEGGGRRLSTALFARWRP